MAQPTIPVIPYSMSSEMGTTTGLHLDANFDELVQSVTELIANISLIQRDDGGIRNQTVTSLAFSSDALALMAGSSVSTSLDWRPIGAWATATLYKVGNIVEQGSPITAYVCAVQHTSGVFATDYAAHKWVVLSAPRSLISADVTSALGFTPVNKAGDTMTGALSLTTASILAGMTIDSALMTTQDLLTVNKGIYSAYASTKAGIIYGMASNVLRTSGNALAVGGQFSAIGGGVAATQSMFGGNINAVGLSTFVQALIGLEIDVGNFEPSSTAAKWGLNLVFKNRGDGLTNPGQYSYAFPFGTYTNAGSGLGVNEYNKNAIAIQIDSQSRTATGEYCGWTRFIEAGEFSLDSQYDAAAPGTRAYPIGINFSGLHYYGGTDPVTAFGLEAAIALRDFQTVWWNRDPAAPYATNKVKTFFNAANSRWVIQNAGVEKAGFDVVTGIFYSNGSALGAGVSLAGNNTWTGNNIWQGQADFSGSTLFTLGAKTLFGNFSATSIANRSFVQTNQANNATEFGILPNGGGALSSVYLCSDSAGANGSVVRISGDNGTAQFAVGPIGTGPAVPIVFANNSSEVLRFDTAGKLCVGTTSSPSTGSNTRFLGPVQIDNQVCFSVHRNGVNFNLNSGVVTAIDWTTKEYDTNTSFNTGTDRFTPPAGKYHLMGAAVGLTIPDATVILVMVYKNGAEWKAGNSVNAASAGANAGSTVACDVDANGTDFFELRVAQVNAGASVIAISGQTFDTYFQGHRIG